MGGGLPRFPIHGHFLVKKSKILLRILQYLHYRIINYFHFFAPFVKNGKNAFFVPGVVDIYSQIC